MSMSTLPALGCFLLLRDTDILGKRCIINSDAIQALVVTTKQSLYADSLYSTVLCIIDERIEQLLEDHQGEEMTPFVRALCCDD